MSVPVIQWFIQWQKNLWNFANILYNTDSNIQKIIKFIVIKYKNNLFKTIIVVFISD